MTDHHQGSITRRLALGLLLFCCVILAPNSGQTTLSNTTNRVVYSGNGTSTAFAVAFPFHAQADLVVIETIVATGIQTTKALTTHYTISGTTDALGHYINGGTVTALVAPASTVTWTIYRDPVRTQLLDLTENGDLPAENLESKLDYVTMLSQRQADLVGRTVRQPDGDTTAIIPMPSKVERASKYLGFNSAGDPQAVDQPGGGAFNGVVIATGTITGSTLADRFARAVNVKDGAAIGNGVADDRAAFAATDAYTTGTITCSAGTYLINSNLTITSPVLFMDGCLLKPASGVTITLNGGVMSSQTQQLFDLSAGGGSIVLIKGQVLRPEWWGAQPGNSGFNSDSTVLAALISCATITQCDGVYLSGRYYIGSRLTVSSTRAFPVFGNGPEVSALIFTAAASGLGLNADNDGTSGPWTVRDFGLYTKFAGNTGPGLTLGYTSSASGNAAGSIIDNVDVSYDPREGTTAYYWNAGIELINAGGVRIYGSVLIGRSTTFDGNGILITGNCTPGPKIIAARFHRWNKAITKGTAASDATEGTTLVNVNMVAVNYGVYMDSSAAGGTPGIQVLGGHISSNLGGVVGINANQINVHGVLFYRMSDATGTYNDISLTNSTTFSVYGNIVGTTGTSGTETFLNIVNSTYGTIDGNTIQGPAGKRAVGVNLDSISQFHVVGPSNQWNGASIAVVTAKTDPRDNPVVIIPVRIFTQTTTATTGTVSPSVTLGDATTYHVEVRLTAVKSDGTQRASYHILGTFYRTAAGAAVQQGATTVLHTVESDAAWTAVFDVSGNDVRVRVTGVAATTIAWYGEMIVTQVKESAAP